MSDFEEEVDPMDPDAVVPPAVASEDEEDPIIGMPDTDGDIDEEDEDEMDGFSTTEPEEGDDLLA